MKTVKMKATESTGGIFVAQHPDAKVGTDKRGEVSTYEVTDVPDDVSLAEVLRRANLTMFYLWGNGEKARHTYSLPYDKLST